MEEVDIIIKTPVSYEVARKGMVRFKSGNIELPVISIANLIKMKKAAGRDIDNPAFARRRLCDISQGSFKNAEC